MSLLIVSLDNTIVNVALPSMRRDLNASVSGLQWIIDAYTLVLASLLMLAGSTADRVGRRRVFQTGLVVFTLGSLLCSLAPSLGWLVAARTVQAVGGSMLNPVALSIVANTFTDPRGRARAIGVWGGVVGVSIALGPVVGGVLVGSAHWRSIFWINIPIGLAALLLTALYVPESKAAKGRRIDAVGQVLVLGVLAFLTYGIIEGPSVGWASPRILGCFAVAAAALAGLAWYEPRRETPLIEFVFFRSVPFSSATVVAVSAFAALAGFLFLNTQYLQHVRGMSALHAGMWTLPMAALAAVCAPLSGRLVGIRGARPSLVVAGLGMTGGALLLTPMDGRTPALRLVAAYLLLGLGFGMVNAPITNAAVSGMPRERAGLAAAIASTSRQVGQALGVAVVGSAIASGLPSPANGATAQAPDPVRLAAASHTGWWIVAACGAVVLLLAVPTTGRWANRTAEQTATRLIPPGDRIEARV